MDEGKHAPWGEGNPDLEKFRDLNYVFPPDSYRPRMEIVKKRPSHYPIHELEKARETIFRSILMPPATRRSISHGRLKSLLGVPSDISQDVYQHFLTGNSYEQLAPTCASSKQADVSDIVVVDDVDYGVEVNHQIEGTALDEVGNASHSDLENLKIKVDVIETKAVVDPEATECDESVVEETRETAELQSASVTADVYPVIKCDYCPFMYEIDRAADHRKPKVTRPMSDHLRNERHYCASSYFARKHESVGMDKVELTERAGHQVVLDHKFYLTSVLAICPQCTLVFETIEQCACHFRYTHDATKSIYGLIRVENITEIKDIFTLQCSVCHQIFDTDHYLHAHWKAEKHHPYPLTDSDGNGYSHIIPCPYRRVSKCNHIFLNLPPLKNHIRKEHSDSGAPCLTVTVRSFYSRHAVKNEKSRNIIETFHMPVLSESDVKYPETEQMIFSRDKFLLKKIIRFFKNVHGYPNHPAEQKHLKKFNDKTENNHHPSKRQRQRMNIVKSDQTLVETDHIRLHEKIMMAQNVGTNRKRSRQINYKRKKRKNARNQNRGGPNCEEGAHSVHVIQGDRKSRVTKTRKRRR